MQKSFHTNIYKAGICFFFACQSSIIQSVNILMVVKN